MNNAKAWVTASRMRAAVAAVVALVLTVLSFDAVAAPGSTVDPTRKGTLVITKLVATGAETRPGTGLPVDTSDMTPLPGVTFQVKKVPGVDLTTNSGWEEAQAMTQAEALEQVKNTSPTASGIAAGDGTLTLSGLPLGLYVVEETGVPAGYAPGAPFLVTLPLTDPENGGWMYKVHVYPKNSAVDVVLDVIDEDAVQLGDPVKWTGSASIPSGSLTGYMLQVDIDPNLALIGGAGGVKVGLDCPCKTSRDGAALPDLVAGQDYNVTLTADGGFQVLFTESGLRKLEEATGECPCARVTVDYDTTVLGVGDLTSTLHLFPCAQAVEEGVGADCALEDSAVTKWRSIEVTVNPCDRPGEPVAGVCFQFYANLEDAKAGRNPIKINGVNEWVTGADGKITVPGVRVSDFVNGESVKVGDPLYRTYYAVMTCTPDGWKGSKEPQPITVGAAGGSDVVLVEVCLVSPEPGPEPGPGPKPEPGPSGGGDGTLSKTGAEIFMAGLLGAAALLLGIVFLRRKRKDEGA